MPLTYSRLSRRKEDHVLINSDHDHHPEAGHPGQVQGNREGFSSSLGVISATLGSAVGLGNIWKFPYETGRNGGAAFIVIYLACVFLVSLPVVTIPTVFTSIPLGTVFMVLFFILVSIAATGAMLSLLEVPVAYLVEERHWTRPFATLAAVIGIALVGSTATLSATVLKTIKPFGLDFIDLYDFLTSNIFMPVGGITIAVFLGWRLKAALVRQAVSNGGTIHNNHLSKVFLFLVRYVAPVAIALILLSGLGIIRH